MAEMNDKKQEPSEGGWGPLATGATALGAGGLLSLLLDGGDAFKGKPGKQVTEMPPAKQAMLAFILDQILARQAQTGGVNPSFKQYLAGGMPRMPAPDPMAVAQLRAAVREPGAFDQRTINQPARGSTFQDVSQAAMTAALLGKLLGEEGGGGGLLPTGSGLDLLKKGAGGARNIYDYIFGGGTPYYEQPPVYSQADATGPVWNPATASGASGGGSWLDFFRW